MTKNSKEYMRAYMKTYNEAKRKKEKINCECGATISAVNLHLHNKTKKHKIYFMLKEKFGNKIEANSIDET